MLVLFSTAVSQAITIGFDPITQDVVLGNPAYVDLFISGLGDYMAPSLGAFDLSIIYDPAILGMSSVTFGDPVLGDQLDIWGLGGNPMGVSTVSPGVENIFEISLDIPWDLEDYQAGSFTLASLTFDTLSLGTSPLNLSNVILSDANGVPLSADVQSGNVNVVPEPATLLLVGSGLAGLGYFGRKRVIKKP